MSGDGLVAPLNAPAAAIPTPGVQPGVSGQIVLAHYVIVFGTAGGVFLYNGTPANGNPPIAWMSTASADPYGNTLSSESNVLVGAGQDGGAQVGLALLSGTKGALVFPLPGLSDVPRAEVAVLGSGADFALVGPMDTTNDLVYMSLLSGLAAISGYEGFLQYQKTDGSNLIMLQWGYPGLGLPLCSGVTAVEPGTGTSAANPAAAESWHSLSLTTVTASGNGVNGFRYRLLATNQLALEWDLATNSVGNNVTIATLPSGWRPATAHNIGSSSYGGSTGLTTGANPHLTVNTNGTIVTGGFAGINFSVCGTALIGLD